MNNHLTIEVNGKPLALGEDFSIDLDFQNPMFNDTESYSYPAEIPLDGNRHLVQNMEDKRSTLRPVSIEGKKARLYADGLPIFDGRLVSSDDEELTTSLSLNIEGNSSLRDLIADLDCSDIPVLNPWDSRLMIGSKVEKAQFYIGARITYSISHNGISPYFWKYSFWSDFSSTAVIDMEPQALGFSVVNHNNINVDRPYPEMPFCNSRVCYKHYALDDEGKTSNSVQEGENGPYFILDADRPQSGICFFVLYFLDCLFAHLGLYWDNSELLKIEDMKRLCFFTTKCKYSTTNVRNPYDPLDTDPSNPVGHDCREGIDKSWAQQWLSANNCGTTISIQPEEEEDPGHIYVPAGGTLYGELTFFVPLIMQTFTIGVHKTLEQEQYIGKDYVLKDWVIDWDRGNWSKIWPSHGKTEEQVKQEIINHLVLAFGPEEWAKGAPITIFDDAREVHIPYTQAIQDTFRISDMYANSDNFPESTVTTILDSLENQFGIRFLYDAELKTVKAVLLRDMYRNTAQPHHFFGEVHSMNKMAERITGVRIGYDEESDAKEQRNDIRDNVKDMETNYDYIDYPRPGSSGQRGIVKACNTDLSKIYKDIYPRVSNTDNTCYIDIQTGNAYRTKVDSEAKKANELHPAWFEVGQFKSVEFGDCSEKNEDNIIEMLSSFIPIIPSDVSRKTNGRDRSFLVPFVDEDMEHEHVPQALAFAADNEVSQICSVVVTLSLEENYNVENTDSGNSPLQDINWELTIAIMRGSRGVNGGTQYFDDNFDGFGNAKYRTIASDYALTADTMDPFGNEWDYDGPDNNTTGRGEHFSLKPRAYKTPEWAPDGIYEGTPLCRADEYSEDEQTWHYFRNRGYVDRFLYEHARFLLDRRKFLIRATCTPAMIMDIKNHWQDRWRINDEIGYINKVAVQIDKNDGIGEAEIEFYAM